MKGCTVQQLKQSKPLFQRNKLSFYLICSSVTTPGSCFRVQPLIPCIHLQRHCHFWWFFDGLFSSEENNTSKMDEAIYQE